MMINIEAKKRICMSNCAAKDQTPQTMISRPENVVWEGIFCKSCMLGKPGLQVDLLTRARVCGTRARVRGGEAGAKQTKGRRDKEKKRQRDEGKTRQRDDGTKGRQTRRRRDEGTKDDGTTNEIGNRQKLDGTEGLSLITTIW